MGQIEIVIKYSKKIETLLGNLGAEGKGMHQKVSDIESHLDNQLVRKIRFIGTMRNKSVHEDGFEIYDFDNFIDQANLVVEELEAILSRAENSRDNIDNSSTNEDDKTSISMIFIGVIVFALGLYIYLNRNQFYSPKYSNTTKNNSIESVDFRNDLIYKGEWDRDALYFSGKHFVEGYVILVKYYGAPGYGENPKIDKVIYTYALKLKEEILLYDTKSMKQKRVTTLQIVGGDRKLLKKYYKSKEILALKGKFFAKHTGSHITDMLLDIEIDNKVDFTKLLSDFSLVKDKQLRWNDIHSRVIEWEFFNPKRVEKKSKEIFGTYVRRGEVVLLNNGKATHMLKGTVPVEWRIELYGDKEGVNIIKFTNNVGSRREGSLILSKRNIKFKKKLCIDDERPMDRYYVYLQKVIFPQKKPFWLAESTYCGGKAGCNFEYTLFFNKPKEAQLEEVKGYCKGI